MLQRWIKSLVVFATTSMLFTACDKEYSKDDPLPEEFKPSLFISSQNEFLYALEPKTGNKIWEYHIGSNVQATPIVLGDFLFLPTADTLFKIDAKRGTHVKSYNFMPEHNFFSFLSSPTGRANMLYIGSVNDTMYALDVNTDKIKWKYATGGPIVSSPILNGAQVIVASSDGKVYSLNEANGSLNWSFTAGTFTSSPTISGNTLYIGSINGSLYAINVVNGSLRWSYPTQGKIESSPIAFGGNIIFGSNDNYIYCIDTAAKKERWKFATGDRIVSSPTAYGQTVFFGGYDNYFYAVDIIDGTQKWKYRTNALIKSSPLVYNGTVYFGSFDKHMYAFDTSGFQLWNRNMDGLLESSPVIWDLNQAFYPPISGLSQY